MFCLILRGLLEDAWLGIGNGGSYDWDKWVDGTALDYTKSALEKPRWSALVFKASDGEWYQDSTFAYRTFVCMGTCEFLLIFYSNMRKDFQIGGWD